MFCGLAALLGVFFVCDLMSPTVGLITDDLRQRRSQ
jgi:hypothetical protein